MCRHVAILFCEILMWKKLACPVRYSTILLNNELARDLTYSKQQLLWQKQVNHALSKGICLAKSSTHNISAIMRLWFQKTTYRKGDLGWPWTAITHSVSKYIRFRSPHEIMNEVRPPTVSGEDVAGLSPVSHRFNRVQTSGARDESKQTCPKPYIANQWSCDRWRHVTWPQKVSVVSLWPKNLWDTITCQPCKVDGWFKLTI